MAPLHKPSYSYDQELVDIVPYALLCCAVTWRMHSPPAKVWESLQVTLHNQRTKYSTTRKPGNPNIRNIWEVVGSNPACVASSIFLDYQISLDLGV